MANINISSGKNNHYMTTPIMREAVCSVANARYATDNVCFMLFVQKFLQNNGNVNRFKEELAYFEKFFGIRKVDVQGQTKFCTEINISYQTLGSLIHGIDAVKQGLDGAEQDVQNACKKAFDEIYQLFWNDNKNRAFKDILPTKAEIILDTYDKDKKFGKYFEETDEYVSDLIEVRDRLENLETNALSETGRYELNCLDALVNDPFGEVMLNTPLMVTSSDMGEEFLASLPKDQDGVYVLSQDDKFHYINKKKNQCDFLRSGDEKVYKAQIDLLKQKLKVLPATDGPSHPLSKEELGEIFTITGYVPCDFLKKFREKVASHEKVIALDLHTNNIAAAKLENRDALAKLQSHLKRYSPQSLPHFIEARRSTVGQIVNQMTNYNEQFIPTHHRKESNFSVDVPEPITIHQQVSSILEGKEPDED